MFAIEWLPDGAAALKAGSNGRYLTARMNGSLQAVSEEVSDRERFVMTLVNRPRLVLRCDHGFVGVKTGGGVGGSGPARYECNRASHDPLKLIPAFSRQESCAAENGTQSGASPVAYYYLMGTLNCSNLISSQLITVKRSPNSCMIKTVDLYMNSDTGLQVDRLIQVGQ